MGSINVSRWLLGGVLAGALMFVFEGVASLIYIEEMTAAMEAHGLSMEMSPTGFVIPVVVSLLVGLVGVFFYAAARPRFGAGPRTALIVATFLFLGGYLPSLLGYQMMGLFSSGLLVLWGVIGYVEVVLAVLLGGWIYREA